MKNVIALAIIFGVIGNAAHAQSQPAAPAPTTPPVVTEAPKATQPAQSSNQIEEAKTEKSKPSDSPKAETK